MTGVKGMVTAARAVIENLAPADVAAELELPGVLLVDTTSKGSNPAGE